MPLLMCDLDDTLVERGPVFRAWAESFVQRRQHAPELVEWIVEQDGGGYRPRQDFLRAVADRVRLDEPLEAFVASYNDEFPSMYRLKPDVEAALHEVRDGGWSVAVVTNGNTEVQSRKLAATGLDAMVDGVCISDDVGCRKPDPRIFELAAERAGAALDGAWMVGDNLVADVGGAAGVGIRSVWVRLDQPWPSYPLTDDRVTADLTASSFCEAIGMVLAAR